MPRTAEEKAAIARRLAKEYYRKNREIILEKRKKEKKSSLKDEDPVFREYQREKAREYRLKNLEKVQAYQKEYYIKNKKKLND